MIPTMKWHKIKNNNMPEKFKAMKLNPNETKDMFVLYIYNETERRIDFNARKQNQKTGKWEWMIDNDTTIDYAVAWMPIPKYK